MTKKCFVFIYLPGQILAVPAGELTMTDSSTTFVYGRRYLQNPARLPVDPLLLPLRQHPFLLDANRLGAIRDATPDFWGRLVFGYGKQGEVFHEMDYLLDENACRVGNLDFRASPSSLEPAVKLPQAISLKDLMDAAEAIEKEIPDRVQQEVLMLLQQGSSIGGARPKTTIVDDEGMWIAKFPSRYDRWSNARVEAATMRLSSLCGVTIPEMKIVDLAGKDVLLIKRFDRETMGRDFVRKGYMSGLSFLEIDENERERFSYLEIADKMRKFGMSGQLAEFFRRMAFNMLCRNTDDHPRNHGFLYQDGSFSLSPAFDVTPTPCAPGVSTVAYLAMTAGTLEGRSATIENVLSASERFGLTREEAGRTVKSMIQTCLTAWEEIFNQYGVRARDKSIFAHTFERWRDDDGHSDHDKKSSFPAIHGPNAS